MSMRSEMVELPDSFLPPIAGARPLSTALARGTSDVSICLRRASDRRIELVREHEPISREALAKGWGADPKDLKSIVEYLSGLDRSIKVVEDERFPALARRMLTVRGPTVRLASAFGVKLMQVTPPDGKPFIVRSGPIRVPADLADAVLGVFGLDNRPLGEPHNAAVDIESEAATVAVPTPREIADLYQFKSVPSCRNEVIALMQFGGGYDPAVVMQYFDDHGFTRPVLVDVGVAGGSNQPPQQPPSKYDREVMLDIEVAGAVAEGAKLVSYFAPMNEQGWIQAISYAVHDSANRPMIMSISWGASEFNRTGPLTWSEAGMKALHGYFEDAYLIGMTVLASAGNHGSSCLATDFRAHVNYPASDPLVAACGGTAIENFATAPNVEIAWKHGGGAGGGGVSDFFPVPLYQQQLALPLSWTKLGTARTLPDIAGYAWPGYDFWIGESQPARMPGTSLVAPLYAGAVARLNAATGYLTGLLHARVYGIANAVRDISDPVSNNVSNGMCGSPGYFGEPGYDARTGLGIFQPGK